MEVGIGRCREETGHEPVSEKTSRVHRSNDEDEMEPGVLQSRRGRRAVSFQSKPPGPAWRFC
jgi:hypothetical protein